MDVMKATDNRWSVRAYTDHPVDKTTVEALIKGATFAPSSMNEQPWAFVVILNATQLAQCSDRIKRHVLKHLKPESPSAKFRDMAYDPDYDIFQRARTLIICASPDADNGKEDCSLAARNLMLAAYTIGLGTCPIGFALLWLNQTRIKRSLGIPDDYVPVFAVVVGYSSGEAPPVQRRAPEMLIWD
jgi:nitroreductase